MIQVIFSLSLPSLTLNFLHQIRVGLVTQTENFDKNMKLPKLLLIWSSLSPAGCTKTTCMTEVNIRVSSWDEMCSHPVQVTIDISAKWTAVSAYVIRLFRKVEIRSRITCKLTHKYVKFSKFLSFKLELPISFDFRKCRHRITHDEFGRHFQSVARKQMANFLTWRRHSLAPPGGWRI